MFIINAPSALSIAYSIIRPFMDEVTRNKAVIYSSREHWQPAIEALIDKEQIPMQYGGLAPDFTPQEAFDSLNPPPTISTATATTITATATTVATVHNNTTTTVHNATATATTIAKTSNVSNSTTVVNTTVESISTTNELSKSNTKDIDEINISLQEASITTTNIQPVTNANGNTTTETDA